MESELPPNAALAPENINNGGIYGNKLEKNVRYKLQSISILHYLNI